MASRRKSQFLNILPITCKFNPLNARLPLLTHNSHVNSIDRFSSGDYLLSGRNVNTIYKIARADKSILWRLGGKISNFSMNFNFTSQHHAKIISENASTTIISILDNASDGWHASSARTSSAMLIALYTSEQPKRAEVSSDRCASWLLLTAIAPPTMVSTRWSPLRQTWQRARTIKRQLPY